MVSSHIQYNPSSFLTQAMITGTCVVVIAMLRTFFPGTLPGVGPQSYTPSDIASFDQIYGVTRGLLSECVDKKLDAEAGWIFAGRPALCSLRTSFANLTCGSTCT